MRTTREKIMVGIAVLAVLYGAYALFSGRRAEGARAAELAGAVGDAGFSGWIEQVQVLLRDASVTPLQRMVVDRALRPWPDELILSAALPRELLEAEEQRLAAIRKAEEDAEKARQERLGEAERRRRLHQELSKRFVYSGYVLRPGDEGGEFCAVVNGVSYRTGETLEGDGHTVKSITAEAVVIVSVEQGIEVTIPISE